MKWETVIGLEVHVELLTQSKIFCGCSAKFGGEPNTRLCPVCTGMPGSLPILNKLVLEYAMRLGIALGCEISRNCKFDRKSYFYPDLPKAYQISQLYAPILRDGQLEIDVDGLKKAIRLREIHMEEDAGKLIHGESDETQMDFNRCGVPLLEIVSQPDFRSSGEVLSYLEKLREILLYLGISDCKMQEGSLRADVNLSVRQPGGELGVRTEMKNLNSFKAIGRAIEYESARQIDILDDGGKIAQETRRWDDVKGESFSLRAKEDAHDYRYFPEPDLLPISISDEWIEQVRQNLPELAHQKRKRYISEYGLSEFEAGVITNHKNISDLYEDISAHSNIPLESARLVTGEVMRLMKQTNTLPEDLSLDGCKLATLVTLVSEGKINRNAYKQTIEEVFINDVEPETYISQNGLLMQSDSGALAETISSVIAKHASAVSDYRNGKDKAFGFLMGQVMKTLGGTANPSLVKEALKQELEN